MLWGSTTVQEKNPTMTKSNQETSPNYANVIAQGVKYRVIVCADDIQWIIQRLSGDRYRSESFCTTKSALIREWQYRVGKAALLPVEFAALPESI
jgi:hypothetical protein